MLYLRKIAIVGIASMAAAANFGLNGMWSASAAAPTAGTYQNVTKTITCQKDLNDWLTQTGSDLSGDVVTFNNNSETVTFPANKTFIATKDVVFNVGSTSGKILILMVQRSISTHLNLVRC